MPLASLKGEDVEVQGGGSHPESHRTGVCLLPLWAVFLRAPGQQVRLCGQRALPPLSDVTADESLHLSFPICQVGFILDLSHRIVLRK